jgi:hypothetical protein
VLGGCSSHNVAIAYRAPDEDLRAWARRGATGWTPEICRTYFDRVFAKTGLEWAPTTEVAQGSLGFTRRTVAPRSGSTSSARRGYACVSRRSKTMMRSAPYGATGITNTVSTQSPMLAKS